MTCRIVVFLSAVMFLSGAVIAEPPGSEGVVSRFRITLKTQAEAEYIGERQPKFEGSAELRYSWQCSGRQRTLNFDALALKEKQGNDVIAEYSLSKQKVIATRNGDTKNLSFEQLPEPLKTIVQDTFDAPLCKIDVDENGGVIKRTTVARPGAKIYIDKGMIANALLFHPPYPPNRDEWQADVEDTMGNGGYVRGKLTYTKVPGGIGGQLVTVAGTLTNEGYKEPGTPITTKKATYVVTGKQTYDPAQKEWISGELSVDLSLQLAHDAGYTGWAKGTQKFIFEKLPDKP